MRNCLAFHMLIFVLLIASQKGTAQSDYASGYKNELRLTLAQPGIDYVRRIFPRMALQTTVSWVPGVVSRVYVGTYNSMLPHMETGSGFKALLMARIDIRNQTALQIGGGYRYFNAPDQWLFVTNTGDLYITNYKVSEKSSTLIGFAGLEWTNDNAKHFCAAFHFRAGISLSHYTIHVSDEQFWDYGILQPTYNPNLRPPPFSSAGQNVYVYLNMGVSLGWRFSPIPL
ncbi:MAG: hypothetical protein ACHQRM_12435 [Bacteroidia bacterium]